MSGVDGPGPARGVWRSDNRELKKYSTARQGGRTPRTDQPMPDPGIASIVIRNKPVAIGASFSLRDEAQGKINIRTEHQRQNGTDKHPLLHTRPVSAAGLWSTLTAATMQAASRDIEF